MVRNRGLRFRRSSPKISCRLFVTPVTLRRLCVIRQIVVLEHVLGAVVDVNPPHAGALHHGVERREVFLDEADQVHRVVLHLGHRLAEALVGLEVGHQAEGHHGQGFLPQVTEEEPVGPDAVEVLVEFPHVRDAVEFGGIVLVAVDQELEAAHQGGQLRALGKGVGAEALEEVRELAVADLRLAEDDDDGIGVGAHGQLRDGSAPRLTMFMPMASSEAFAAAASRTLGLSRGISPAKRPADSV